MILNKLSKQQQAAFKGSILGGAIGDSYGSSYENIVSPFNVSIKNSTWNITDDTQLTIATCESIFLNNSINPEHIAKTFKSWFNENKISNTGASTLKALRELQVGGHWALVGRKGEYAAGNGAAMRIAPIAYFINTHDFKHKLLINDICKITHNNDEAYCGALAVILAIQFFSKEKDINPKKYFDFITSRLPDSNIRDKLYEIAKQLKYSIKEIGKQYGTSSYVIESIPFSIFCASKIISLSFEKILTEIIRAGQDTDTNCSITGQIIGAHLTKKNIPQELLSKLYSIKNFSIIDSIINHPIINY